MPKSDPPAAHADPHPPEHCHLALPSRPLGLSGCCVWLAGHPFVKEAAARRRWKWRRGGGPSGSFSRQFSAKGRLTPAACRAGAGGGRRGGQGSGVSFQCFPPSPGAPRQLRSVRSSAVLLFRCYWLVLGDVVTTPTRRGSPRSFQMGHCEAQTGAQKKYPAMHLRSRNAHIIACNIYWLI